MSDPSFVALLRGINVGGKNILPMRALAEIFRHAGATEIRTYIQSGNVIFRAAEPEMVATKVRTVIASDFGLKVPVVVRSAAEIANAVAANPFVQLGVDPASIHLLFLADQPSAERIAKLDIHRSPPDEFALRGRDVYLRLPNGAARTRLTATWFDSTLKTIGTQRNWRTVLTLAEMMGLERL